MHEIKAENNYMKLSKKIIALFIVLLTPLAMMADGFTVVLDAGHGGKDPGTVGSVKTNREKDIVLNVVLQVGQLLKANNPDINVIYTRNKDVFVELGRRAEIANNAKANLFVSVHVNSVPKGGSKSVAGVQSYSLTLNTADVNLEVEKQENSVINLESSGAQKKYKYDNTAEAKIMYELMQDTDLKESVIFAKMAQREMVNNAGRINKGVQQANFAVLRLTYMPSVLLEIGFISNPSEEQYLMSSSGQSNIARSIYNAIVKYHKSIAN